jgi:adenylosuccinate synthase
MRTKVVIGANFGDEGKGLMTDYFVDKFNGNCFVVRFNGGAQAGHTVVTPEGKRHKFSHFGSGSFLGAPTYLSKYFILNPLLFMKEQQELGFRPRVCVDFDCLVSTPYDMFINQALENSRGETKHGSCGVGIHETIVRSEQEEFRIKAIDFLNFDRVERKLRRVAEEYYPKRMEELGLPLASFDHDKFIDIFEGFDLNIELGDTETLLEGGHDLIFEGAQGLLLDQNHPNFPFVTHSNTGFQNVREILKDIGVSMDDVEVVYVTRSYMTRHGRGPFPTETEAPPYKNIVDDTNVFHEFQEHLRFGILDVSALAKEIRRDCARTVNFDFSVAVTCLDQVDDFYVRYVFKDEYRHTPISTFLEDLWFEVPYQRLFTSFGKTRAAVSEKNPVILKTAV